MYTIKIQLDKNLFTFFWSHNPIEQITYSNASRTNASNGKLPRTRARAPPSVKGNHVDASLCKINETGGISFAYTAHPIAPDWENVKSSFEIPRPQAGAPFQLAFLMRIFDTDDDKRQYCARAGCWDGAGGRRLEFCNGVVCYLWVYLQLPKMMTIVRL